MATAPLGKAQRFLNVDTGRVYPQQVGKFLKTMEEQVGKLAQTPEWLQYKKDQIAFVRDLIKSAAKDSKGRVKVKDVWDATQKVPQGPMTTEGRGGLRPLFYRTLQDRTSYTGIKTAGQGRQIWDEALPYTSPNPVEKGATEAYYGILSKMREK